MKHLHYNYDIAVIGGGPAGLAAAITAGGRTLLTQNAILSMEDEK